MPLGDMKVREVEIEPDVFGYDPPLEDHWSELTKLRWHAAVANISGLDIHIRVGGSFINGIPEFDVYGLSVFGYSFSPMSYQECAIYIHGMTIGYLTASNKIFRALEGEFQGEGVHAAKR